jgi:demethylmenaquinone methyltransferase/2-methoxy-6-polyprenyl-1,4-benzoquinol methylase
MADFDHFGLLAPFYERLIPPRQPERLIELASLPVMGSILDAGGGTGRIAQFLRGRSRQVVVADVSLGMLSQAAGKSGLDTVCSVSEHLPFPSDFFERIVMVDALHHVFSQGETASELWRVLKPGGRILIQEPDIRRLIVKLVALAEKLALMRSRFLSPARITELFPYPDARTRIVKESYNAWILVEKWR